MLPLRQAARKPMAPKSVQFGAVLEGTRSLLAASGLPHRWWNHAARHWCFMRNVTSVCAGEPSPYECRFGEPFAVKKLYSFGSKIFYKLMLEDANAKGRKFERKAAEGTLVGFVVHPGEKRTKDYRVLDLETVSKELQ